MARNFGACGEVPVTPTLGGFGMDVPRACIAIPGVWTDHWFDAPDAWWAWACAWAGWTVDDWRTFRADWDRSGRTGREALMRSSGVRFLDWRQVPGGSMFGKVDAAAAVLKGHLDELPPGTDVTLIGHSKGGNVIKRYLTGLPGARHTHGMQPAGDPELANLPLRTTSVRAVMICAPVDHLAIGLESNKEINAPPKPITAANARSMGRLRPFAVRKRLIPNTDVVILSTNITARFVIKNKAMRFIDQILRRFVEASLRCG